MKKILLFFLVSYMNAVSYKPPKKIYMPVEHYQSSYPFITGNTVGDAMGIGKGCCLHGGVIRNVDEGLRRTYC